MNKYVKALLYILAIFISILLASPFISLSLPKKYANRAYYRLIYRVIVEKETAGCRTNEETADKIFQYISNHEFAMGTPFECKPVESLIYAQAYCDFQARTLNELLGIAGIFSRYDMLLDKSGISPHTLNEVFLHGKWCVFDPAMNIIFKDKSGKMLSLDEISANPGLILNSKKLIALKEYDQPEYSVREKWYCELFPMPLPPIRSKPVILKYHIFDYMIDAYFKIFKYNFSDFYQDLYLKFNKCGLREADLILFFKARNYHLCYRDDLAFKYYNLLLKQFPDSKYAKDAILFKGMLYFDTGDFHKAIEAFNLAIEKDPGWSKVANFYLGRAYANLGDDQASLEAYSKTFILNLSDRILEELNKRGLKKH